MNVASPGRGVAIRDERQRLASLADRGFGSVTFQPRSLKAAVNRVRAEVSARVPSGADVAVEVRGRTGKSWGQWTPATGAPATLGRRADRVQVRLLLYANDNGQSPRVTGLRLTGDSVPGARQVRPAAPLTYEVFATREGLVGETTANGHVIQPRDHFVALPSTRSLSPEGTDDYSVKVCSPDTGRCEIAPVWDVGPWNIDDDYWSPSSVRENWTDLAQGTPESEAAYINGYNNGLDGFGREVVNPAGIDLADGTFWDGLGLADNAWVEVTYLWTTAAQATTQTGSGEEPVTIRSAPSTGATDVGLAARHVTVPVRCQTHGDAVSGRHGTSDLWNKIGPEQYISAAHTVGMDGTDAPRC